MNQVSATPQKGKKRKVVIISTLVLFLLFSALYFFQKAQYSQSKVSLPDSHSLLAKINLPLELESKNKPLYDWCIKQPIYQAYELCEPYFSKALQANDYSIEDLLGDKSVVFCLDEEKNGLVYIPLSNHDDFFIEPIKEFLNSEPKGIKKHDNYYSLSEKETSIYIYINDEILLFSDSETTIKKALKPTTDTELSDLITDKNQLIINLNKLDILFPDKNPITQQLKQWGGNSNYLTTSFDFINDEIRFESQSAGNNLELFSQQDKVSSSLTHLIPSSAVNLTFYSVSNPLQLNEDIEERWKTNATGSLDLRIDFKEKYQLTTETFFESIEGSLLSIDFNTKRSQLSRTLLVELKTKLPQDWFSLAIPTVVANDTLYTFEKADLNKIFFGASITTTTLPYFYQKDNTLYLFEDLYAAKFFIKNRSNTISKPLYKLIEKELGKGQVSSFSFPAKNTAFLKRASHLDLALWKYFNEMTSVACSWKNNKIKGSITFEVSEYEKTKSASFLPVYELDETTNNHILYLKEHQLAPNLIAYSNDEITVYDNFGEPITKHKVKGEILDIQVQKECFFIQTTTHHYTYNSKWQLTNSFETKQITNDNYIGFLKKHKNYIFCYQNEKTLVITDEKGKEVRAFEIKEGAIQHHLIDGKTYFSQVNDTVFSFYNEKGKTNKKIVNQLKCSLGISPFVFQNHLIFIYENGTVDLLTIQDGLIESKDIQLLGQPQPLYFHNKPVLLAETSQSRVKIYNSQFDKVFTIKEPFSESVNCKLLTSEYILIHDLKKHHAMICNKQGHLLTQPFTLTDHGEIIISRNRIYRLDNFQEKFELHYLKI